MLFLSVAGWREERRFPHRAMPRGIPDPEEAVWAACGRERSIFTIMNYDGNELGLSIFIGWLIARWKSFGRFIAWLVLGIRANTTTMVDDPVGYRCWLRMNHSIPLTRSCCAIRNIYDRHLCVRPIDRDCCCVDGLEINTLRLHLA